MDDILSMEGFSIDYWDQYGNIQKTFLHKPISNICNFKDDEFGVILFMFYNAHPGCKIISIKPFNFLDFNKENNK